MAARREDKRNDRENMRDANGPRKHWLLSREITANFRRICGDDPFSGAKGRRRARTEPGQASRGRRRGGAAPAGDGGVFGRHALIVKPMI